ncbi:7-cyano-7-deazaguanine synthase QueC [Amycolatopsis thermophila]|uniref:7-cyano-7-deazaguanine synthase n=1 Tax=Amycolatopsis thermophila TaxID=206084 RepID=A0ABU0END4_9PSEU|nr:7-cyano-7-deazaguanine synthase QueC [Amycolatopsis thermophila]MDQ0376510.1 7-cyano-7-deazaguanine synthase [Amycolatopsis thermophila]
MTERRDLVLLSGGLDSATALGLRHAEGTARVALSVNYGQRHARELRSAAEVAAHYGVEHRVLDLTSWGTHLSGSALTDTDVAVPHGHYAAPSMAATVVPNRNATLLMAAAGVALSTGCTHVVAAMHAGDHPIYPDCRPEFVDAARRTIELGTDGAVTLDAPFVHISKTAIAARAGDLAVPVGLTWSCYEGREVHCGQCGTCVERREAFADSGVADPTVYEVAA